MAYTTDAAELQKIRDALSKLRETPLEWYSIADLQVHYRKISELEASERKLLARMTSGVALATFRRPV